MKTIITRILTVTAIVFLIAGCSASKTSSVDTSEFESSFKSAEASAKATSDKIVSELKNSDYSTALADLKALKDKPNLTPDQQKAIADVLAQVQQALAEAGGKTAADAGKAAQDLPKSLPK
jgi:uncharacterized lipoprotein